MRWYVQTNGQTSGPVDDNTVAAWVREQRLGPGSVLAAEGANEWIPFERSPFVSLQPQQSARSSGISSLAKALLAIAGLAVLGFGSCVVLMAVGAKRAADQSALANESIRKNAERSAALPSPDPVEALADVGMNGIYQKVTNDALTQYDIAKRNGSAMDACVHAGFVAAAYLQAKDEDNYKKWRAIESTDCGHAGLPR